MTAVHPWRRFVAIGDSFTEGIGDPEPKSIGGHRGWADRVAEVLAEPVEDFAYANLAVRGKVLQQIVDEQAEAALELKPDLISVSAGGNDIIRLGTDPDAIAARFDRLMRILRRDGATVLMFTGPDIGMTPVLRRSRGKVAIYNENLRAIAHNHDAIVADMWAVRELADARMWDQDRLHFSPIGHHTVARMALSALNVENSLRPLNPVPLPARAWRQARADDLVWAREHLVPWVVRRLRNESTGDALSPKRPTF